MENESSSRWSNKSLLKALKNPGDKPYKIIMQNPEVTFLGANNQPDFAKVTLIMVPGEKIIELKSLKYYFFDFRNRVISYERFVNVLCDNLVEIYAPVHLKVVARFRPRGGISSILVADSRKRSS